MKTKKIHKIAVIAGDGIGPEVIAEGEKVLRQVARLDGTFAFSFTHFPWGCEYYLKTGRMMPADALKTLSGFDAIFLGAVGFPGVPDHVSLRELLLEIRHGFDQYVNIRPVKLLPGAPCPLVGAKPEDIDMIFVRENSEGEYSGSGAWLYKDTPEEVVIQNGVFSRKGTERIIRYAYALARREKKTLTSISKGNALNYSMVFWDQVFKEVGREYPDVETHALLVDAASIRIRSASRWSWPPTSLATSSPTSGRRSPAGWGLRPARTSTPSAGIRRCLSRSTVARPTSRDAASQIRSRPCGAPRRCSSSWATGDGRTRCSA